MHVRGTAAFSVVICGLKRRNPSFLARETLRFEPSEPRSAACAHGALPDGRTFGFKARCSLAAGWGSLLLLAEWAFGTAAGSGSEAPSRGDIGCRALGGAAEQSCPCPAAELPN